MLQLGKVIVVPAKEVKVQHCSILHLHLNEIIAFIENYLNYTIRDSFRSRTIEKRVCI